MKIEYTLTEDDLVTHQLYESSRSERIRKRRRLSSWLMPSVFLIFVVLHFFQGRYISVCVFLLFIIAHLLWYPAYTRRRYLKHYRNFVQERQKNRIGQPEEAVMSEDEIAVKFEGASSQVLYTALEKITELPCHVLLHLRAGSAFVLPKRDFTDETAVLAYIKDRAAAHNLPYADEQDWVWK